MQATKPRYDVVLADERLVSHAGVGLLAELADRVGLTAAVERFAARSRGRARRHEPARVLRDLIVVLADGGTALSDLRLLAGCGQLLGPVASVPTAWRVVERLAQAGEDGLAGLRAARAQARARAWQAGAAPAGRWILDVDATLLDAHTDRKQGAAGSYKHTFGFHPLACWLDRGDGRGEALAGICAPAAPAPTTRPTTLPSWSSRWPSSLPGRGAAAGSWCGPAAPVPPRVRLAPAPAWAAVLGWAAHRRPRPRGRPRPAPGGMDASGRRRRPAAGWRLVAEATGWLDLTAWPPGTRAVCRKERPHPGARPRFVDPDGNRYQVFATDQPDRDLARLELRHRRHARVEDRIRAAKATGLANLPFDAGVATPPGSSWSWPPRT